MIKRHLILIIIFSIWISACSGRKEKIDCHKFQRGVFLIKKSAWNDEITIKRYDSLQSEKESKTGDITFLKFDWTGDCNYELTFIEKDRIDTVNGRLRTIVIDTTKKTRLKATILTTNDKYYVFEARKDGSDFVYNDTMWVIGLIGGFKPIGKIFADE